MRGRSPRRCTKCLKQIGDDTRSIDQSGIVHHDRKLVEIEALGRAEAGAFRFQRVRARRCFLLEAVPAFGRFVNDDFELAVRLGFEVPQRIRGVGALLRIQAIVEDESFHVGKIHEIVQQGLIQSARAGAEGGQYLDLVRDGMCGGNGRIQE